MQPEETVESMLQQYVSSMVKAKGEQNADEAALVAKLSDQIDTAVLDALPTESLEKMVALDKEGKLSGDTYDQILGDSGIDQDSVVSKAMTGFREAYLRGEAI